MDCKDKHLEVFSQILGLGDVSFTSLFSLPCLFLLTGSLTNFFFSFLYLCL